MNQEDETKGNGLPGLHILWVGVRIYIHLFLYSFVVPCYYKTETNPSPRLETQQSLTKRFPIPRV